MGPWMMVVIAFVVIFFLLLIAFMCIVNLGRTVRKLEQKQRGSDYDAARLTKWVEQIDRRQ